jgi:hypothetical protein
MAEPIVELLNMCVFEIAEPIKIGNYTAYCATLGFVASVLSLIYIMLNVKL